MTLMARMDLSNLPEILLKLSLASLETIITGNPLAMAKGFIEVGSEEGTKAVKEFAGRHDSAMQLANAVSRAGTRFLAESNARGYRLPERFEEPETYEATLKVVTEMTDDWDGHELILQFKQLFVLLLPSAPGEEIDQLSKRYLELLKLELVKLEKYWQPVIGETILDIDRRSRRVEEKLDRLGQELPTTEPLPQPGIFIPFPRNPGFVGRSEDLERLNRSLQAQNRMGIRPAALTGMGGIGKTQLAVEYAYRYQEKYPGGIYWINAAQDWIMEVAVQAENIGLSANENAEISRQRSQARAFLKYLNNHADALIIFDNVEDSRQLQVPLEGVLPSELHCQMLFTTRKRGSNPHFQFFDLQVLPESAALELLLSARTRREGMKDNTTELAEARKICAMLGYLPLALALASGYLGMNQRVSLVAYRKLLAKEGLAVLEQSGVQAEDLSTRHDASVSATLKLSWQAVKDENAHLLLQAASLLGEAAQIPRARLALLTGLVDQSPYGLPAPLETALNELNTLSLVEELGDQDLRLHPLVAKFVGQTIDERETFSNACAARIANTLLDPTQMNQAVVEHGIDATLSDLRLVERLSTDGIIRKQGKDLLRLLDQEAHTLRSWRPESEPGFLLQQLRNRCLVLRLSNLQALYEHRLEESGLPFFAERVNWVRGSGALLRTLKSNTEGINAILLHPDGRRVFSASDDGILKTWNLDSGACLQTIEAHASGINGIILHPDQRRMVSASSDHTLKIWDLESETCLHTLEGHEGRVKAVVLHPDGRRVLSASADHTSKIWDLETGICLITLQGHSNHVNGFLLHPDGRTLVTASSDHLLKAWDLDSGACLQTLPGHSDAVNAVALHPDGRRVISASADRTLKVWDLESGQCLQTLQDHSGGVNAVGLCPDGRRIVSASTDHTVKVWDLWSGSCLQTLEGHSKSVNAVVLSPDGRRIISASLDRSLRAWDLESGACLQVFEGHSSQVNAILLHPDGQRIVSASADSSIKVWDLAGGSSQALQSHSTQVNEISLSPDGRQAVSASDDTTLRFWDLENGACVHTLEGHSDKVLTCTLHPDGRRVVSASSDRTLKVWDVKTGECLQTLRGHYRKVNAVAVHPDGHIVASASDDSMVMIWDLVNNACLYILQGHYSCVNAVAFHPDGQRLISASWDHRLRVWDYRREECLQILAEHTNWVNAFLLHPDGCRVVSASTDSTLKVWNLETGACLKTLRGHMGGVRAVALHPDGRRVISASTDHTLKVWDLAKGNCLQTLQGHTGRVKAVVVHPDGDIAFSASDDGSLKAWNLESGACLGTLIGDAAFNCIAITKDGNQVIAGDSAGVVHFNHWIKGRPEMHISSAA
jgi:WD40 repeat protein